MKNKVLSSLVVIGVAVILTASPTVSFAGPKGAPSIVDIVLSHPDVDGDGEGDFDTLLAAVTMADSSVLDRLSRNGQNTVFAPTDAAFEAAFTELELLGIDPGDVLADTGLLTLVLNYHIAPGRRDSVSVLESEKIRMRDGGFLDQDMGMLTDNLGRDAAIIAVDIPARNGIIHVIDNVILPALP